MFFYFLFLSIREQNNYKKVNLAESGTFLESRTIFGCTTNLKKGINTQYTTQSAFPQWMW